MHEMPFENLAVRLAFGHRRGVDAQTWNRLLEPDLVMRTLTALRRAHERNQSAVESRREEWLRYTEVLGPDLDATPEQLVDLWPHVQALRVPTLLLRGGESDFLTAATAEEMARRNPLIRYAQVPGASHYVHDDNLAGFQAELHPFLDSLAAAGKGQP